MARRDDRRDPAAGDRGAHERVGDALLVRPHRGVGDQHPLGPSRGVGVAGREQVRGVRVGAERADEVLGCPAIERNASERRPGRPRAPGSGASAPSRTASRTG